MPSVQDPSSKLCGNAVPPASDATSLILFASWWVLLPEADVNQQPLCARQAEVVLLCFPIGAGVDDCQRVVFLLLLVATGTINFIVSRVTRRQVPESIQDGLLPQSLCRVPIHIHLVIRWRV